MRVAVALLFVLAACVIFALQASHCALAQAGNETYNDTGYNDSVNQSATVDNSTGLDNTTDIISNDSTDYTDQADITDYAIDGLIDNTNQSEEDVSDTDYIIAGGDELYTGTYDDNNDNNNDDSNADDYALNDTDDYDYLIYTNQSEIPELLENPPGYGAITGVILSSVDSHAIPNATVALYDEYGYLADVPDNPQLSSSGNGNNAGVYTFTDVPLGVYNVTADKGGISYFAIVDLSSGTATANVVLPEYVETEPAYMPYQPPATPSPTPRPFTYFLPIKVGKMPASTPTGEGLPFGLATVGGLFALILFTRRNGKA